MSNMRINTRMKEITLRLTYKEFIGLRGFCDIKKYIEAVVPDGIGEFSIEEVMYKDFKHIK